MVQITNSFLIVAAVVAPTFAAPVLEVREPINKGSFKTVAKIGGGIASGASLGMSVAPLVQHQQRELEARRITGSQAKSIAHGVGQASSALKSGVELGATVGSLLPHKQRRSVEADLVPRFRISVVASNAQHRQRDYEESEIDAREPFLGAIFKVAKKFIREDEGDELLARDFDEPELDAREPFIGAILKVAKKFIREDEGDELLARDFEEVEIINVREPFIGAILKVAKKFIREDEGHELLARDFDEPELDAREPFIGAILKVAKKFIRETDGLDELD